MARRLASLEEFCTYAGIGERTARRWIAEGTIPAYRLGERIIRVDLNEVDTILCQPIPTAKSSRPLTPSQRKAGERLAAR